MGWGDDYKSHMVVAYLKCYPDVRIAGYATETRTGYLSNTRLELYRHTKLLRFKIPQGYIIPTSSVRTITYI
jgi:hypothetical protein